MNGNESGLDPVEEVRSLIVSLVGDDVMVLLSEETLLRELPLDSLAFYEMAVALDLSEGELELVANESATFGLLCRVVAASGKP